MAMAMRDYEAQTEDAAPKEETAFERLAAAVGFLDEAVGRSRKLADRMCGPLPPEATKAEGPASLPGGLIDQVKRNADIVSRYASAINSALNRIEQRI